MKRGTIIKLVVLLLLAVLLAGWFGFTFLRALSLRPEGYAAADSGTLLITYMEQHDGEWPRSWEDLRCFVEMEDPEGLSLYGYGLQEDDGDYIAWMSEMVAIDWEADPNVLRSSACCDGEPPFEVVTRPDGCRLSFVYEGAEPNEMIWRYLHGLEW